MDKNAEDSTDPTEGLRGGDRKALAKRYFRALKRLKDVLATLPGGGEGL